MPRKKKSKKGKAKDGNKRGEARGGKISGKERRRNEKGGNRGQRKKERRFKRQKMDKEEKAWMDHWNDFQAAVAKRGCYLKDIDGDGNCLFRAISDQILNTEDQHKQLRKICVEYMKKNEETLKFFLDEDDLSFEEYVDTMRQTGSWAGYFELYCLSVALGVNFTIVRKDLNVINIHHFPQEDVRTFFLAFHEDDDNNIYEHYSSIRLPDDNSGTKVALTRQIPFNLFKPILTNNDAKRKAQEQVRGQKNTSVKFGKKMTRKERKKIKKRKKFEDKEDQMEMIDDDSNGNEADSARIQVIKPVLIEKRMEIKMNESLVSKLDELDFKVN